MMSSTAEQSSALLGFSGGMAHDTAISSTDESSFISENGGVQESESKTTTPSASPKPHDFIEPQGTSDVENSQHVSHDASSIPHDQFDGSDDDDDNKSVQSDVSDVTIATRLRRLASSWRHKTFMSREARKVRPDVANMTALQNHLKMMEWISGLLKEVPSEASLDSEPEIERVKCIPELRCMKWRRWLGRPPPPPPPPGYPRPTTPELPADTYAVCLLTEEPPFYSRALSQPRLGEGDQDASPVTTGRPARPNGIAYLPPQLRVNSLPVRRIFTRLADSRLWEGVRGGNIQLYRPYKMFVHQENAIRKELSTLARLCAEATQSVAPEATEITTESQKDKAQDLNSNQDEAVDNHDDHIEDAAESDKSSVASGVSVSTTSLRRVLFTDPEWKDHSREELQEAHDDLRVVVDFMDSYLVPLRTALNDTDDTRVLYNELWHVFNPGSIVYVKDPSVPQKLWRVIQGQGGDWSPAIAPPQIDDHFKLGGSSYRTSIPPFTLDCFYIDFNGTHFVRVIRKFEIEEFKELTSVKSLSVLPLKVAEREGLVDVNSIERRGLKFLSFLQPGYCHFRGRSLSHEPRGDILKRPDPGSITSVAVLSESIESSVVVDFERCLQTITDWNPCREPRQLTTLYEGAPRPPPNVDDDRIWDLRMAEKVLNYTDQNQNLELYSRSPPAGDDVLLLPDRVFAYVLRTRKWACIPIGAGKDDNTLMRMEPKNSAWNDLQIDPRHRSIIESMMATHFRKKKSKRRQFDLIQDKGKGLIVLLHGVPGVGKTSTAETVAQYYNKPLLPITCGDLGMTPAEVETNLQDSFQLAQAWDCVLLLDEADVFLAERSQDNIERNALVSVFLRVMEYYEGILFLTTNKVGSFDEAFKSRMSLALYYPPLTQDQTEKIWRVQMERTEQLSKEAAPDDNTQHVSFNRLEIEILAKELWNLQQSRPDFKPVWNGRQIRNAFQTAVALAEWHQQENNIPGPIHVKREHFEKVALVSNEFNAYLWTVKHRRGDDILNLRKEHRFDQFDRHQFGWGGPGFGQHNQQQSGFGGWDNSQYSNTMGSRGPSGMGMGGPGFGNNMQNQSGFGNSWQSGFGGMSGAGVGGPGIATGGMGGSVMGNSALGNPNIGNSNVGAAMQPGVMSPQAMPGQNMGGQPAEGQQQQQQLQQQQLQQPNIQQGGSMQSMYGQSNPQSRPSGW